MANTVNKDTKIRITQYADQNECFVDVGSDKRASYYKSYYATCNKVDALRKVAKLMGLSVIIKEIPDGASHTG